MWADNLATFDLESTGIDTETARIVTACVARVSAKERDVKVWLADPGIDIPAEATAVHGITTEHARDHGRPTADVVREINEALYWVRRDQLPLVIYNAPYDLTLLDREGRRTGFAGLDMRGMHIIDPLVIDRAMDPYRRGSRKLVDVCRHYGITLTDAHTAEGDAIAAARLAWRLAKVYPDSLGDLDALQERQAVWYHTWAISFEDYLRRQGKTESIDRDWPIRPYTEQAGAVA
ncbi:exonuclease domain-containing protein [Actinophytocola sediminis]